MNLHRNETMTGLLVVVTFAVAALALALSGPGLFRHPKTFYIYFDNASGIQAGTDILLAGRKVGQVVELQSPVPLEKRPVGHQELETRIEVKVERDAKIYRSVTVNMMPYGLLGEQKIDFVNGDESSGLAQSGSSWVGHRMASLTDATESVTERLEQLRITLDNINQLTGEGSDLRQTVNNAKQFSATIKDEPWRLIWKKKKKPEKEGG